ncbi:MAG: ABC transporter substrate-binding protein [Geminicoccaceae bacterium]
MMTPMVKKLVPAIQATSIAAILAVAWPTPANSLTPVAEVLHFWVSSGERRAIDTLASAFEARGGRWIDIPRDSYAAARREAVDRIGAGFPPTAMLWVIGRDVQQLADLDIVNDVDVVAQREQWHRFIPPIVMKQVQLNGRVVAAPIGIHGENWAWYNREIYQELGLSLPDTWQEVVEQAPIIEAAGYFPIAASDEAWQQRILFNAILISVGGADSYRRLFADGDPTVVDEPAFRESLEIYGQLRRFANDAETASVWSDVTKLVVEKRAAMQIMGDWAKGDFKVAGQSPGREFDCRLAPGSRDNIIVNVDVFAFARTSDREAIAAQQLLASTMLDPAVQLDFSLAKGALPVRLDVDVGALDDCGRIGVAALAKTENVLPTPSVLAHEVIETSVPIMLADFWLNHDMTVEAVAAALRAELTRFNP